MERIYFNNYFSLLFLSSKKLVKNLKEYLFLIGTMKKTLDEIPMESLYAIQDVLSRIFIQGRTAPLYALPYVEM